MNLGVQYYRPPFPVQTFWADDFKRIRDSGLNTVQLWVLWSWVEATPGRFVFDDYDRLVELAEKTGLGVVLSTIAEVQPYWIHREIPGSEMIDSMGHRVVSSNRQECHFGITPGGCTDNPAVWARMSRFLAETVRRFKGSPALVGWDAWNELRWNVQADGLVCFCPHTIAAFRAWLDKKYGGLAGLNQAWLRRYGAWDEVHPGKKAGRPYTEMMAWQHFITSKCDRHGRARYELMKTIDPKHPVTLHAATPSPLMAGWAEEYALERGNDWFYGDALDGVGCSSFPKWGGIDDADFGLRVECVKSAAQGKRVWLSEVQGGRASTGFNVYDRVDAASQQRWIWNGLACGADTILFWCWRDEVFGSESAGFGLAGNDGLAEERLAAMRVTGNLLDTHRKLFATYQPGQPQVGLLFSPQAYYLAWSQEQTAKRMCNALTGYARALVRRSIPYRMVEEEHLGAMAGLKVLFLPRAIVTSEATEKKLAAFVRAGGTLVCESECGAFSPVGIYRYPQERFIAKLTGVAEVGRRALAGPAIEAMIDGATLTIPATQWVTPMVGRNGKPPVQCWASHEDGSLVCEVKVGKGRVILVGTYLGDAYRETPSMDFEGFLESIVRGAGCKPAVEVLSPAPTKDSFLYVKSGSAGGRRIVFVFFPPGCDLAKLRFAPGWFKGGKLTDIIAGQEVKVARSECVVAAPPLRISVLVGG